MSPWAPRNVLLGISVSGQSWFVAGISEFSMGHRRWVRSTGRSRQLETLRVPLDSWTCPRSLPCWCSTWRLVTAYVRDVSEQFLNGTSAETENSGDLSHDRSNKRAVPLTTDQSLYITNHAVCDRFYEVVRDRRFRRITKQPIIGINADVYAASSIVTYIRNHVLFLHHHPATSRSNFLSNSKLRNFISSTFK